jgi:hypothetical protein
MQGAMLIVAILIVVWTRSIPMNAIVVLAAIGVARQSIAYHRARKQAEVAS